MSYCSPSVKNATYTCFNINALRKIASAYNKKYNDKINLSLSKKELWNAIRERLSSKCGDDETCWLDYDIAKRETQFHKPRSPKGQWTWLSTVDINQVMRQYEEAYKGFVFFGPLPIDFISIRTELNSIDLGNLVKKGVKSIGIIFNLDPHYKSGSHWTALYINIEQMIIGYFDSYAVCPYPKEINRLINSLNKSAVKVFGKKFLIKCNKIQHQIENTECGVYSMHFIIESLKGRSFEDITKRIILDDEMNKYRSVYFRPYKEK
jgi:hypothetical protein